jgi:uracil phosphoribosyltransferase
MALQMRIHVPPHPFINQLLAVCRDKNTPTPVFRSAVADLGRWLAYEALRDFLPTVEVGVYTPLDLAASATVVDSRVPLAVVPVLRAGLALLDGILPLLPTATVHHLGYARNEKSLLADCYLDRLPKVFAAETRVLILEPMLATGGTSVAVMEKILERGALTENIRIISVICAPPALQALSQRYSDLVIYSAMIDEQLNDQGYITPGLGDAGDRAFGT